MDFGKGTGEKDGEFVRVWQATERADGWFELGGRCDAAVGVRGQLGKSREVSEVDIGLVGEEIVTGLRRRGGIDLAKEPGGFERDGGADLDRETIKFESARRMDDTGQGVRMIDQFAVVARLGGKLHLVGEEEDAFEELLGFLDLEFVGLGEAEDDVGVEFGG